MGFKRPEPPKILSGRELLVANVEGAQSLLNECKAQIAEFEHKLACLLKRASECAAEIAPTLEAYKNLKSPEVRVVSVQEFGAIKGRLRFQRKLALTIRDEIETLHKSLNHLKEKTLPKRESDLQAAEEALSRWTNIIPFRGRT